MSLSRWFSAVGALLITVGTAIGTVNPNYAKWSIFIVAVGGALNTFSERIQGGASTPGR